MVYYVNPLYRQPLDTMTDDQVLFTARVPRKLRSEFEAAARSADRNASQLVRDYMRRFIAQRTKETTSCPIQSQ